MREFVVWRTSIALSLVGMPGYVTARMERKRRRIFPGCQTPSLIELRVGRAGTGPADGFGRAPAIPQVPAPAPASQPSPPGPSSRPGAPGNYRPLHKQGCGKSGRDAGATRPERTLWFGPSPRGAPSTRKPKPKRLREPKPEGTGWTRNRGRPIRSIWFRSPELANPKIPALFSLSRVITFTRILRRELGFQRFATAPGRTQSATGEQKWTATHPCRVRLSTPFAPVVVFQAVTGTAAAKVGPGVVKTC